MRSVFIQTIDFLIDAVRKVLRSFNVEIKKYSTLQELLEIDRRFEILGGCPPEILAPLIAKSHAQNFQDIFVLSEIGFKRGGYFIEFGAADGIYLSNSYMLEREFGWTGIVAEPCVEFHADLQANRACKVDTRCVWSQSDDDLEFWAASTPTLSTLKRFEECDGNVDLRREGVSYMVKTISLMDLLKKHQAPRDIDYLSIDTEGSEFEILKNFDFVSETY